MKRIIAGGGAALLLLLALAPAAAGVDTSAGSALLMDASSGRVLWEKDAHQRREMASVTKLMTALVALESGHGPEETVRIEKEWVGAEGSSLYLREGEEITLEALLYGLLLQSGNDAALAVAGFCGGEVEAFGEEMNRRAKELGMEDTHFANPNGLSDSDHYSSAYDLALLARACLENETLAQIVSTRSATFGGRVLVNHNKLLWRYEGCVGLKTGYTENAGRTLVSAARRDGMTLICVTLDDPNDWADHTALFDWGFQNYQLATLVRAGEQVCSLPAEGGLIPLCPVTAGAEAQVCLTQGEKAQRQLVLDSSCLTAPLQAGSPVGEAVYSVNGEELLRVPLVTGAAVPDDRAGERSWLDRLRELVGL